MRSRSPSPSQVGHCYNCGRQGHFHIDCPIKKRYQSFREISVICRFFKKPTIGQEGQISVPNSKCLELKEPVKSAIVIIQLKSCSTIYVPVIVRDMKVNTVINIINF